MPEPKDPVPPCDCIAMSYGFWIDHCDCQNSGDLREAVAWCSEMNERKTRAGEGMKPLKITISTPPPSLNVLLRMHYHKRVKLKRRIRLEVWAQTRMQGIRGYRPIMDKVTITGTLWGKQPLDPDNLIGSLKPVIDALVRGQVLIDDTEKHISIGEIKQKKLPKGEVARLELTIERREE